MHGDDVRDVYKRQQGFLTLLAGIAAGERVAWLLVRIRQPGFDYVATLSIVSLFLLVAMAWQMSDGRCV